MEEIRKELMNKCLCNWFIEAKSRNAEDELVQFIQDKIDLAVSKERSRIVSIVDMYFEEEKSSNTGSRLVYEHIADDKERVINLINTK